MPWKPAGRAKIGGRVQKVWRSPSGKLWSRKMIAAYKATHGFSRPVRSRRRR